MSNKRILIIAIILIVVALGVSFYSYQQNVKETTSNSREVATSSSQIVAGPVIKISPPSFDLGIVKYGDVTRRIFKITNQGDEPLKILRLSTSCGCTSASIVDKDKIIAPGETVDMSVAFDPAVHKDDTDLGNLTRIIYVESNDPQQVEMEVKIYANVIKVPKK